MPEAASTTPLWVTIALVVLDFSVKVAAVGVIPQNRRPSSASAWLLLVLFLPFVGIVAFLLLGSTSVDRGRRRIHREVNEFVSERFATARTTRSPTVEPAWLASAVVMNQTLGTLPCTWGNTVELCSDYEESIAVMTREVQQARRFVNVQFYIMSWDHATGPFFEALVAAEQRGVTVRVLFDHIACRGIDG